MSSRARVLSSIRRSLHDVDAGERPLQVNVPRGHDEGNAADVFVQRVHEYRADVKRVDTAAVSAEVSRVCGAHGVSSLAVPDGIDSRWLPQDVDVVPAGGLTPSGLDRLGGALTGCRLAIAETGTIVLDGGPASGRRAITLVPDLHICVVSADQVVRSVPEAVERLRVAVADDGVPLTFVSGPSATSDIEFRRVEGVHGPRRLVVLVTD